MCFNNNMHPEVLGHRGCKAKVKQSLDRPLGFQEVEALRFQDNQHMKLARLSALRTGRPYSPGNIPGTHFC